MDADSRPVFCVNIFFYILTTVFTYATYHFLVCILDGSAAADPSLFEGHDQIGDPRRYGRWVCYHRRIRHGDVHSVWSKMKTVNAETCIFTDNIVGT